MAQKSNIRPVLGQQKPLTRPMTEQEKQAKIMQFLAQKREQFAVNILCNLVHVASERVVARRDSTDLSLDTNGLVNSAVKMADELLEKLYPIKEEGEK